LRLRLTRRLRKNLASSQRCSRFEMKIEAVLAELARHVQDANRRNPQLETGCTVTANTVFKFLTDIQMPVFDGMVKLLDARVDSVLVSDSVPRKVTYVDLTGTGMGSVDTASVFSAGSAARTNTRWAR
jgi:hypothetical protein